ncbi:capsular biosynthesis protein [Vibrio rotiferianus]|uniref:capsular biosynthesis protein n=1 Tax=Vibrio rotiferianus TaxID=190895 RepID=UPI00406AA77A
MQIRAFSYLKEYSRYKDKLFNSLAIAGALRVVSSACAISLTILVAHISNAQTTGEFFLIFNLLFFLSIVGQLGYDHALLKTNAIAHSNQHRTQQCKNLHVALQNSLLFCLLLCGLAFMAFRLFMSQTTIPESTFIMMLFGVPLVAFSQLISRALQAQNKLFSSLFSFQLGINSLIVLVLISIPLKRPLSSDELMGVLLTVIAVVAMLSAILGIKSGALTSIKPARNKALTKSAHEIWLGNIVLQSAQWLSLPIAALLITSSELGLLATAQRTSLVVGFILVTINFVFSPKFASYYQQKELNKLKRLSHLSCRLSLMVSAFPLIALLLYSEYIMRLFGDEFASAASLLKILALGQMVNAATGSTGCLLLMTGFEETVRKISFTSSFILIVLLVVLTYLFGVLGSAWAITISTTLQNLMFLYYVKVRLGFSPIG